MAYLVVGPWPPGDPLDPEAGSSPGADHVLQEPAFGAPVGAGLPTPDGGARAFARLALTNGGPCPRRNLDVAGAEIVGSGERLAGPADLEDAEHYRDTGALLGHRCRARGS